MAEVEAQEIVSEIVNAFAMEFARLGADQNRATQAQYRRYLLDLPAAATRAAVERMLATAKFVPKIAEIRDAVRALELGPVRTGAEAWGDVQRGFQRWGATSVPAFSDPVVARVVRALGWRDLCLSENTVADRARFIESYEQIAATSRRDEMVAGLPANRQLAQARQAAIAAPTLRALPPAEPYDERDDDPFDSSRWNRKAVNS